MFEGLRVLERQNMRVLTTPQIAKLYGTTRKIISYNFQYNKKKYVEGKHYIKLEGKELSEFKNCLDGQDSLKYAHTLYLWTEKGALLHAKSLNTDKAWQVYDYLVDFYFRAKEKEPELPPKKEVVPTQTKTEPVKSKVAVPHMEEPIFVFKNLLALAEEQGITLKLQDLREFDSVLYRKNVAIRKQQLFEKVVYETAYELAHYFIHYDQGNLVKSPLQKDYNEQAERAAVMMIRMLDIKAKQKY